MRPPARCSNTVSAMSTPSMLCSRGLMRSICSMKTANARSTGALTTTSLRTDVASAGVAITPLGGLVGDVLEGRQGLVPEGVKLRPQRREARGVGLVDAPVALRAVHDNAGILEHLQMLGDRGSANRQLAG